MFQTSDAHEFAVIFGHAHPFQNDHRIHTKSVFPSDAITTGGDGGAYKYEACYYIDRTTTACKDPKIIVQPVNPFMLTISRLTVDFHGRAGKQAVTVVNDGDSPVEVNIEEKPQEHKGFDVKSHCQGALDVGQSCTIDIIFSPPGSERLELLVRYQGGQQTITVNRGQ
jgi:hypothetical protein